MAKKGVSLIVLSITIVVLAVLTTVMLVGTTEISDKTRVAKLGEEFKLLEDTIKEYYAINGTLPIDSEAKYTKTQLINLNTLGQGELLQAEIDKNKDATSTFYEINYSLISTTIKERGIEVTQDDIYVVSSNNNVYYVQGVTIGEKVYFSLANISVVTQVD